MIMVLTYDWKKGSLCRNYKGKASSQNMIHCYLAYGSQRFTGNFWYYCFNPSRSLITILFLQRSLCNYPHWNWIKIFACVTFIALNQTNTSVAIIHSNLNVVNQKNTFITVIHSSLNTLRLSYNVVQLLQTSASLRQKCLQRKVEICASLFF